MSMGDPLSKWGQTQAGFKLFYIYISYRPYKCIEFHKTKNSAASSPQQQMVPGFVKMQKLPSMDAREEKMTKMILVDGDTIHK